MKKLDRDVETKELANQYSLVQGAVVRIEYNGLKFGSASS